MGDDGPLVVARSPLRERALAGLLGGVGAAAAGHLLWGRVGGRPGQVAAVLALTGTGAAVGRLSSAARRGEPALVLTSEALHDHASVAGVGELPWDEVTGVGVRRLPGSDIVQLQVADRDAVLRRRPWWSRAVVRWNERAIGAPVNIPVAACAVGPISLHEEITARVSTAATGPGGPGSGATPD
ncbi:hypothetical protein KLP28_00135 [Nocardioidaceae bacterium]|nr:hypothetical protein KLP28_00135 [Nocardioidaceae bacterium]